MSNFQRCYKDIQDVELDLLMGVIFSCCDTGNGDFLAQSVHVSRADVSLAEASCENIQS